MKIMTDKIFPESILKSRLVLTGGFFITRRGNIFAA
jgi:hypothetical protein